MPLTAFSLVSRSGACSCSSSVSNLGASRSGDLFVYWWLAASFVFSLSASVSSSRAAGGRRLGRIRAGVETDDPDDNSPENQHTHQEQTNGPYLYYGDI